MENMVYYNLEGNWRINETHRYHLEFEKAVPVAESGFLFLSFRHPNKIKS